MSNSAWSVTSLLCRVSAIVLVLVLMAGPLLADGTNASPSSEESFGSYLAAHQDDLAPFFSKNASEFFRLALPALMGLLGWVILLTMAVGWVIDVLMSYGFAFFFAPAFAGVKRALVYATGRLVLSAVYTALLGLTVVMGMKMAAYAGAVMVTVIVILVLVALAAQIVWILYLYRATFAISAAFYIALLVVHTAAGLVIARPVIGVKAKGVATDFIDRVITPKLQAEADAKKRDLAEAESARQAAQAKISDFQVELTQAQMEESQARQQIEAKKNSDVYLFGEIIQTRAKNNLELARDQLATFLSKHPDSSLHGLAQQQLTQVNNELAEAEAQKKQSEADAAQAAAMARADLLARAGKGEVTLSEMRQALLGKSREEVSGLLGKPSETNSESWVYSRPMIYNPLTNAKSGLMVNFEEGAVQGVDYQSISYNQNEGTQ